MPVLERVADAFSLDRLHNPTLGAMRVSYDLAGGRMTVRPFTVKVADIDVTIAGSHGIDQTLRYDLALAAPRALLGSAANTAITKLAAQAGKFGADVSAGDVVRLKAQITGTVTRPAVNPSFAGTATTLREATESAVKEQVAASTEEVKQKADSALEETRRRARAEADRILAEAQRQADTIRANARALATKVKQEANARADSLVAQATNPVAKKAAQLGTDRIRRGAEQQADRLIREADARADALVADAKRRGEALVPPPP
jgi:vacuolar-type H+-ATPase subunit H